MVRCALLALALSASLAPFVVHAQVQRNFPANALRGEVSMTDPPDIAVNGRPARLAPGARLRGQDNMIVVSGALQGQRFVAHYTLDTLGLVKDVWVLRKEEAIGLWPRTPAEAAAWRFDPAAQAWTKP